MNCEITVDSDCSFNESEFAFGRMYLRFLMRHQPYCINTISTLHLLRYELRLDFQQCAPLSLE